MPLPVLLREALADALVLAFPVECAGCGAEDIALCPPCRTALAPRVTSRVLEPGLAVFSGVPFDGVCARVIRSLKEDGRLGLARDLAPLLRAAADAVDADGAVLVTMPTSRAAFRRRGYRVVDTVARRADLPVARLLLPARRTSDQRALGREQRRSNVSGSLRATDAAGLRVVILDDVVTTGATLLEAARALRAGGATVLGAATIASTPRRRRPVDDSLETGR